MSESDPISGLGKILDAKTTKKIYEDAIAPAAKQVGAVAGDVVKGLRLFTAPFQLAAAYQDRLTGWLDDVRNRVPVERQVEAPAHIAGPVLMNLRFIEDDNILKELYLNLLARAIDKDSQQAAHPAFVKIIEQLSPLEASLLSAMKTEAIGPLIIQETVYHKSELYFRDIITVINRRFPGLKFDPYLDDQEFQALLAHLAHLALIDYSFVIEPVVNIPPGETKVDANVVHFRMKYSTFGLLFAVTCIPGEFNLPPSQ